MDGGEVHPARLVLESHHYSRPETPPPPHAHTQTHTHTHTPQPSLLPPQDSSTSTSSTTDLLPSARSHPNTHTHTHTRGDTLSVLFMRGSLCVSCPCPGAVMIQQGKGSDLTRRHKSINFSTSLHNPLIINILSLNIFTEGMPALYCLITHL